MMARTRYVDRTTAWNRPVAIRGSLLVDPHETAELAALEKSGVWKIEKVISDVDNRPTVAILRKLR